MIIKKEIKQFSKEDLKLLFTSIFEIPSFAKNDLNYFYNDEDEVSFWHISCNSTGYSMELYQDYTIKLDNSVYNVRYIPTIKIIEALTVIKAI